MVVLFTQSSLIGLNFLPHETAANGIKGVFETDTGRELGAEDCVALAAGAAGELAYLGSYDPQRVLHDREQIQRIADKTLEEYLPEAKTIIQQNLRFFALLNRLVRGRITTILLAVGSMDWEDLPAKIEIITLAQVDQVYKRVQSERTP